MCIRDRVGHLTYFDGTAALAITDPDGFSAHLEELMRLLTDAHAVEEETLGAYRKMEPGELLDAWRAGRRALAEASATLGDDDRVVWYGPSMGSKSFLTARLMECWAHGIDVLDAVGRRTEPTDRLYHIARLGFNTRGWSYVNNKREVPSVDVRVELVAPSGEVWTFGPDEAMESIVGPAIDFCQVVTQRRHVEDTALAVAGAAATEWMSIAQAFAGPPTTGPEPR